ncbi:MAG: ABC transporter permease [Alphaproteobacteria bacterium]|nr:ABC transporter permease [Alphaproteobacteria bacterium]
MAGVVAAPAGQAGLAAAPARGLPADSTPWLLLAPATLALVILFLLPIGYVLLLSVTDPAVSIAHYRRIFSVPLYTRVLFNTFTTALTVTGVCLLLGYPVAYVMARRSDWVSTALLICVAVCFWTGFIVRTYAWLVILGNKGPVVAVYQAFGFGAPPRLLFTTFSSILGMVHILLPYMVLALYSVMKKIDPNLLRASASLGARPAASFRAVYLPLTLPGVVNGSILVFTICLGFFITPILLGTPKDMMISQLINQQIEELLAWGFASAVAVVLLVATSIVLAVYNRFAGLDRLWG